MRLGDATVTQRQSLLPPPTLAQPLPSQRKVGGPLLPGSTARACSRRYAEGASGEGPNTDRGRRSFGDRPGSSQNPGTDGPILFSSAVVAMVRSLASLGQRRTLGDQPRAAPTILVR